MSTPEAMPVDQADLQRQNLEFQRQDLEFQRQQGRLQAEANTERGIDLAKYTASILKTTLDHAAKTYQRITLMSYLMFLIGLGLFVTAAVYGIVANDDKQYAALFAGMGAVTFVALFLTGPIEKTQTALSNLVQVEVSFMNYFSQITLWETYAYQLAGDPPAPTSANMEKASQMLQQRSGETAKLLQDYLEPEDEPAHSEVSEHGGANAPARVVNSEATTRDGPS